jgi:hypothetical protein
MSAFIVGIALIERSGRKIRNVLNDLKLELLPKPGTQPITEIETTKISNQFHRSRIYEFLCIIKPMPRIFVTASKRKIIVKALFTTSIFRFGIETY